jgi:DNA-binding response OmpR family regulator
LTLIIGPLESLLSKSPDNGTRSEYELMLRQAKRLLTFINQLLELSRLEKGVQTMTAVKDNFNRFVRTIISSYNSFASDLGIELIFKDECDELNDWFDKDKVEKIVTNLVTNALKFTNSGGRVETMLRFDTGKQLVQLIVRDNGIGIEPQHLQHIFEPFYQVDSTVNQRMQGTGIGLSLVKELVALHHGTIEVNSSIQQGTEFIVQLPFLDESFSSTAEPGVDQEVALLSNGIESLDDDQGTHKGKKVILLVEDNDDMRTFIRTNLPDTYLITEAINGKEGIDKAGELMPDLIITDVMMPFINGVDMARIIKQDERISHIPIIMLTAKVSMENKLEGLSTQADDYITKPFNMKELSLRIENLLSSRERLREKFSRSITVNPSELVTTSMDERFLQKALLLVEKNMDATEFSAEQFCDEMGMSRAQVHRKLKALTGQSATHFIRSIRLKRAAQMLKQQSGSVSEIAYQTGFNNLSYFTKCFKEQYGVLPSDAVNQK